MYSRKLGNKTLTFGHEGVLFKSSFVMYDKQTDSLWVHTLGTAVKGPLKGKQLEFLPSLVTTWGRWKEKHPKTRVLTGRKARGMMGSFNLTRHAKRYGLSVGQGKKVKLYSFPLLMERRLLQDEFDGEQIVVVFDEEGATGLAFKRGKHSFTWKDGKMLDEKGKEWDPLTGTSGKGTLARIPATPWLIARWKGFYPDGDVYRE